MSRDEWQRGSETSGRDEQRRAAEWSGREEQRREAERSRDEKPRGAETSSREAQGSTATICGNRSPDGFRQGWPPAAGISVQASQAAEDRLLVRGLVALVADRCEPEWP